MRKISLVAADGRWFALGLFSFFFGFFLRFLRFFWQGASAMTKLYGLRVLRLMSAASAFGLRLFGFCLRLLWLWSVANWLFESAVVVAFGLRLFRLVVFNDFEFCSTIVSIIISFASAFGLRLFAFLACGCFGFLGLR